MMIDNTQLNDYQSHVRISHFLSQQMSILYYLTACPTTCISRFAESQNVAVLLFRNTSDSEARTRRNVWVQRQSFEVGQKSRSRGHFGLEVLTPLILSRWSVRWGDRSNNTLSVTTTAKSRGFRTTVQKTQDTGMHRVAKESVRKQQQTYHCKAASNTVVSAMISHHTAIVFLHYRTVWTIASINSTIFHKVIRQVCKASICIAHTQNNL